LRFAAKVDPNMVLKAAKIN